MPGEGGCTGTCPPRMGTRDHLGAPVQRTAQVSPSSGEDLHRRLQEGNLLQIRHHTKLDLSLEKVSTDAGVRLRNLKRRRGFDANILPQKRPALSVAERVAKVDNVALLEMFVMLFCTCLAHTQLFCTNTCTYLVLGERRSARDLFAIYSKNKLFSGPTTRR